MLNVLSLFSAGIAGAQAAFWRIDPALLAADETMTLAT
jgi:hypothetical protein